MEILFGMYLDGAAWSGKPAAIGEIRVGPMGMLGILESELGLSGPSIHPVHRINAYMKRLEKLDSGEAWFHRSFSVDPWSVSRQLLMWRDQLVEAGWKGETLAGDSPRLKALSGLEGIPELLPAGDSDRIREAIDKLRNGFAVHIESICLAEPRDILPPAWQEVFYLLEKQGTLISAGEDKVLAEKGSFLSGIQSVLLGAENQAAGDSGDGSVILLKAENEWDAAENIALWLSSESGKNRDVSIICGMDTAVLDQCLQGHSLPRLGRAEPSSWREMHQLLPLMLANSWKPVDVRRLAELLSLTVAPFPKWACRYIMRAISREPGVGGMAWKEALSKIEETKRKRLEEKGDTKAAEKARSFASEMQKLLVEDRFDPVEGIPEESLSERFAAIMKIISWRLQAEPELKEVAGQVMEMKRLSEGKGKIPRLTLERMLDTVIGAGSSPRGAFEEAGNWNAADNPGQIADSCGEIVWWGFDDSGSHSSAYWSKRERDSLKSRGVLIEEPGIERMREASSWRNAVLMAKKRFIAVHVSNVDGNESYHHPYWDSIICASNQNEGNDSEDEVKKNIVKECSSLAIGGKWNFAGRRSVLEKVVEARPSKSDYVLKVPKKAVKGPEKLSYSQMSTLMGCPMKWALEYHSGLRIPESQAIPTGNQMIGSLCHRIIEELYSEKRSIGECQAKEKAGKLFDMLVPSMASELLLDGNSIRRQRTRHSVVEAVGRLVSSINRFGLTVEKTEAELKGSLEGIAFIGYADMLLRDETGKAFILDLKWSGSSRYRREEVKEGRALQLAAYAWMIRAQEPGSEADAGYFMLAQGEMISDSPAVGDEAVESECGLDEIWETGASSVMDDILELAEGSIEARGAMEKEFALNEGMDTNKAMEEFKLKRTGEGKLYVSPPCGFCDFGRICGLIGGSHE